MRMASAVGKIMPAHCTALGKAILACLSADTVRRLLHAQCMPHRTVHTSTNISRLVDARTTTRVRGFAIDNVENEDGIRCVPAAVLDHQGQVAGAVSRSGSTGSVTLDRARRDLEPRVRTTALRTLSAFEWTRPRIAKEG